MKTGHFLGSLTLAASVVVACGGGSSGGGGGGGSSDSFIGQLCDALAPCCGKTGKTYDRGKCVGLYTALTASSTYDAASGQQCLDAMHAEANNPTFCDGLSPDGSAKCKQVFKAGAPSGTKQPGETCDNDSDCASNADGEGNCATSFTKDASIRQCQIQARGKLGDDCVGEKETTTNGTTVTTTSGSGSTSGPPPTRVILCFIDDHLFCETTFTSGTTTQTHKCAKIQDIGGPCTSTASNACVKTAFCDTKAKACVARKASGDACDTFSGDQCVEKNYCNSTTKKCTPSTPNGGACAKNEECENRSCTNGKCGSGISSIGTTAFVCQ